MSVICRCPDQKLRLFCKGADTSVFPLLLEINPQALYHLDKFASSLLLYFSFYLKSGGLRTLCFASKVVESDFYDSWLLRYNFANSLVEERTQHVDSISAEIEINMNYVGLSAIEDKLQFGVNQAITQLREAGIKVWVLTGDKYETAKSIGFSCGVLTKEMELIELKYCSFIDLDLRCVI